MVLITSSNTNSTGLSDKIMTNPNGSRIERRRKKKQKKKYLYENKVRRMNGMTKNNQKEEKFEFFAIIVFYDLTTYRQC